MISYFYGDDNDMKNVLEYLMLYSKNRNYNKIYMYGDSNKIHKGEYIGDEKNLFDIVMQRKSIKY